MECYAGGMRIDFLKMQGLGNDFLVFDVPALTDGGMLDPGVLRALANRHTGIGFDQALALGTPRDARNAISYRVFNADGGEVEQCGNGARCVAALVHAREPERGRTLTMESAAGLIEARVLDDGSVAVNMGIPNFDPRSLPMSFAAEQAVYSVAVDDAMLDFGAVSMGNPHVVMRVSDIKTAQLERFAPSIANHGLFPNRTNVGFMEIVDRDHIRLRVYERGVGETLACGTGACAAVAIGRRREWLDADVRVDLPGGTARVSWSGAGQPLWLTGPAKTVFSGSVDI